MQSSRVVYSYGRWVSALSGDGFARKTPCSFSGYRLIGIFSFVAAKAGSLEDPVYIVTAEAKYAPLNWHYYRPKNCSELWQKFYSSFAYKSACDFDINSYDEFLRAARHNISAYNKVRNAVCLNDKILVKAHANNRRYTGSKCFPYAVPDQLSSSSQNFRRTHFPYHTQQHTAVTLRRSVGNNTTQINIVIQLAVYTAVEKQLSISPSSVHTL